MRFHAPLEASRLREAEVNEFLTHLAVRKCGCLDSKPGAMRPALLLRQGGRASSRPRRGSRPSPPSPD
ncbi:MAG: hypothetical protein M3198_08445 [Actinomycetota bacterium]|nr:hypothetical protein [Actinomycetota bacterium]